MKSKYWLTLALVLAMGIAWLGWASLNLMIENDGLRQVSEGHKRSINALLVYAQLASRCDINPEQLAEALNTTVTPASANHAMLEVANLAFKAQFEGSRLDRVEVVDVGKVKVCRAG